MHDGCGREEKGGLSLHGLILHLRMQFLDHCNARPPGRAELHFNFSEDQNAVEEGTQIAYLRILKGWGENLEMIKSTTQRPPISISVRHPN